MDEDVSLLTIAGGTALGLLGTVGAIVAWNKAKKIPGAIADIAYDIKKEKERQEREKIRQANLKVLQQQSDERAAEVKRILAKIEKWRGCIVEYLYLCCIIEQNKKYRMMDTNNV